MKPISPSMTRSIFTLTMLCIPLTFSSQAFTQSVTNGTIQGKVIHASDQSPFSQVNIAVYSLPDSMLVSGSASDDQGTFTVAKLPFGNYTITISYIGFQPIIRDATLTANSPIANLGTLALHESTTELAGVEVVTVKPGIIYQADKKIIDVAQMKQAGATTLVEVLENAPGITTDTEGNVLLRGSSSYKLLIDGKPSPVAGTSLLRQLPADMVESIEIITNPSAKYEAEGAAGIINLILKTQKTAGFMGQATLTAGWNNKYIGDLQLNYRKKKVNLFAGASANSIKTNASGVINQTLFNDTSSIDRNSNLFQDVLIKSINLNAGIDWDINNRNSITLSGRGGKIYNDVLVDNKISIGISDAPSTQWLLYTNALSLDGTFYNPQFSYRHKFDDQGHQLDVDVFTGGFSGDLIQLTHEYPSDDSWNQGSVYNTRNKTLTKLDINDTRLKTDYVKPFANGNKIEAGALLQLYVDGSDYLFQNWNPTSESWIDNDLLSNDLLLKRTIYAGYGIWSGTISKITYSLGLRGEYTDRRVDQKTMDEQFDRTYMNLFPSGSASLQLPLEQSLQISFSRRINRPGGMELNPFPQFVDNKTIRTGNPELDPELVQSYEFSYQKQTKVGLVTAQTYYRRVKDVSSFSMTLDDLGRVLLLPMNANRSHSTGLELTGNITATQWLRLMASGNLFYYILQDETMPDDLANEMLSWNARLNTVFLFSADTRFVVSANYTGPTVMLQGRMGGNFVLNLGFTQTFLKRQASVTLGVRDLLGTGRTELENYTNNLKVYTNIRGEAPMVILTLTYNLNNFQQRTPDDQMDLNFIR